MEQLDVADPQDLKGAPPHLPWVPGEQEADKIDVRAAVGGHAPSPGQKWAGAWLCTWAMPEWLAQGFCSGQYNAVSRFEMRMFTGVMIPHVSEPWEQPGDPDVTPSCPQVVTEKLLYPGHGGRVICVLSEAAEAQRGKAVCSWMYRKCMELDRPSLEPSL